MRKFILLLMVAVSMAAEGQVVFTKFKFSRDSPFGCCPGRKMTEAKFKITGEKDVRQIMVEYSGVDELGDAVCSDIVGGVNANVKHTKYYCFGVKGPFKVGKTYSRWASGTFWYSAKVTAFPSKVTVEYMDRSESDVILITKENISEYFPKIKWIDVDYEHGFQPDN